LTDYLVQPVYGQTAVKTKRCLLLQCAPEICKEKQPGSEKDQEQGSGFFQISAESMKKSPKNRGLFMEGILHRYFIYGAGRGTERYNRQAAYKPEDIQQEQIHKPV